MLQARSSAPSLLPSLRRGRWPIHSVYPVCKSSLAGECLGQDVATGMVAWCIFCGPPLSVIDDYLECSYPLADWTPLKDYPKIKKEKALEEYKTKLWPKPPVVLPIRDYPSFTNNCFLLCPQACSKGSALLIAAKWLHSFYFGIRIASRRSVAKTDWFLIFFRGPQKQQQHVICLFLIPCSPDNLPLDNLMFWFPFYLFVPCAISLKKTV